jgi:hypothetical protein
MLKFLNSFNNTQIDQDYEIIYKDIPEELLVFIKNKIYVHEMLGNIVTEKFIDQCIVDSQYKELISMSTDIKRRILESKDSFQEYE